MLRVVVVVLLGIGILFPNGAFTSMPTSAQDSEAKGVHFVKDSWEDILQLAKDEGKPIFVDFYAKWCGPCKYMNRFVFTRKRAGRYFNKHFISVKIDAETQSGRKLARKYGVNAYPTMFFLQADESILLKAIGARNTGQLIRLGKQALNADKQE